MSKKKSALIFIAGAVAGWKVAQRAVGDTQDKQSFGAEPVSAQSVASGPDPFRGAFKEALAEVNLHNVAEDNTEVA